MAWAIPVILLVSTLPIVANIGNVQTLLSRATGGGTITDTPVQKNVFLLIFNPVIESQGGVKLTQLKQWSDPDTTTNSLLLQFPQASHGYLSYTIKERQEVDGYFTKPSGFTFTDTSYLSCLQNPSTCNAEIIDYQELFTTYNICAKNVDEVWIWGGPWFGYWEYNPVTFCGKTQFVMGFSYERAFGEALHDFGHRMEFVGMQRVGNGQWGYASIYQNENNGWNKFSLLNGHCGNIHYPPGTILGGTEYFYNNPAPVTTDCDGYLTYPTGPFIPQTITCALWNCTQEGYVQWWLSHIPHATGTTTVNQKTIYNNWWKYYTFYDETANPLPTPTPLTSPTPTSFTNLSSLLIPQRATFSFTSTGPATDTLTIDMSITSDMSWGTYLSFAQGTQSPIVETNPEKWDQYTCGRQFWWRVKTSNGYQSSIQSAQVVCETPTPTPSPMLTPTPTPTINPTPTPRPTMTPTPTLIPTVTPTLVPTPTPIPPTPTPHPTPTPTPTVAPTPTPIPSPTPLTCNPADINRDGIVDDKDANLLITNLLVTNRPVLARTDINHDGIVDIIDYSILAANYLTTTGPCQ